MDNQHYHLHNNIKLNSARNIIVILLVLLLFGAIWIYATGAVRAYVVWMVLALIGLVNFVFLHYIYKHIVRMKDDYQQMTSYMQLRDRLGGFDQLPNNRGYAGSPDFLNYILDIVELHEPKTILEASCGISSVTLAAYFEHHDLDKVKHYALEHDDFFRQLCANKVSRLNSHILHAPQKSYSLNGKLWKWYDMSPIDLVKDIDLLIIDGPPAYWQKESRYPALPLLIDRLSEDCIILLDDCYRPQDQRIAERWADEFGFTFNLVPAEKGIGVLKRSK